MDCKRALDESNGDVDKAEQILKEQGIASAAKKAGRDTDQGLIETYIHSGGRIGAMVEVNCETDFVARTKEFSDLAHDIAMQIAAMNPLTVEDGEVETESDNSSLLQQPFIKDPSKNIQELINDTVG